ncbi:MAG: helix-turn-helix domain-containing protein [Clostridia bacterium]
MSLGSRIRDLRKMRKLTQNEIAVQLQMGRSNFGHIENDRVVPSSDDLQKLADILETTTDYLLGRTDERVVPSHGIRQGEENIPGWATSKDKRDFKKMLQEDGDLLFDGIPLDDDDRQRIMDVLTGLFWEAKQMNKRTKTQGKHTTNDAE